MNVQFALKGEVVWMLEVNPCASRTVPYAGKATNLNLANKAAQVMAGKTLLELGVTKEPPEENPIGGYGLSMRR